MNPFTRPLRYPGNDPEGGQAPALHPWAGEPWQVSLMGGLSLTREGRRVTRFKTQKVAALFAYLALYPERDHLRDLLIAQTWPEADEKSGRNRLSVALSSIRTALHDSDLPKEAVLVADRATVRLNPLVFATDVGGYERALRRAEAAPTGTRCELLEESVRLYGGELLPGFYEDWVRDERQRLEVSYLGAVKRLVSLLEVSGDTKSVLPHALKWVTADPHSEEAHRAVMRLHLAQGEYPAAARQFARLEQRLREYGIQPSPDTLRLLKPVGIDTEEGRALPKDAPSPPRGLPDHRADSPASEGAPQAGGGRRIVTVLCMGKHEPEGVQGPHSGEEEIEGFNLFLRHAGEIVGRYGGEVKQLLGERVLAVFGEAQAHEDDPERAVYAAQEIQNIASDLGVSVSIGIETGEAYIAPAPSPGYPQATISSPAIRRAESLLLEAPPETLLIGETTYQCVRRAIASGSRALIHPVSSSPSPAYSVDRALLRPRKGRGVEGLRTELVGREGDFLALKDRLESVRQREDGLAVLTGEAGIGKSRLVAELRETPGLRGQGPLWLEGRSQQWDLATGYSLFADLFRTLFNLTPGEGGQAQADLVRDAVREANAGGRFSVEQADEIASYLAHLLSIKAGWDDGLRDLDPEQIRHKTFIAVGDYLRLLAEAQPLVLVFEDLHWADPLSLDLILYLMDRLKGAGVLTLCLYREETGHPCARIATRGRQKLPGAFLKIDLDRLSSEDSHGLLASLLTSEALPPGADAIVDRCDGNPFFLEEVVRSLFQRGEIVQREGRLEIGGADGLPVLPETVQGVIRSRLDPLSSSNREILQRASVLGRRFQRKVLEHLLGGGDPLPPVVSGEEVAQRLWELEQLGFIALEKTFPEEEYGFRHALTQETVYHGIPRKQLREAHLSAAEALENVYRDRVEEQSENLARHYTHGEDWRRAADHLVASARKAARLYANGPAIGYYRQALGCLSSLSDREGEGSLGGLILREDLGDLLLLTGAHAEAEAEFSKAVEMFPRSPAAEGKSLARLYCKTADTLYWQDKPSGAIETAEKGLAALGESHAPCEEEAMLLEVMCRSSRKRYDYDSARRYIDRATPIIEALPKSRYSQKVYYEAAWIDIRQENFPGAERWLKALEAVCLKGDNEEGLARCYHGFGDLYRNTGDLQAAVDWFQRSLVYCEKIGHAQLLLEGYLERAHLLILLGGDPLIVRDHVDKGLDMAARMAATTPVEPLLLLCQWVQEAFVEVGDVRSAMEFFDASLVYGQPTPDDLYGLEVLCNRSGCQEWFRDYCRRAREVNVPRGHELRFWHRTEDLPDTTLASAWREAFDGNRLDEAWSWHNPSGINSYCLLPEGPEGNGIEIRVPCDLSYRKSPPTAPRLTRVVSGDFAVEAVLAVSGTGDRQAGGLILWIDGENFALFGKRSVLPNELRVEARSDGNYGTLGRGLFSGHEIRLRFERRGRSLKAQYRIGDDGWYLCAELTLPETDPVNVGLYGVCPDHWEASCVRFLEMRGYQDAPC